MATSTELLRAAEHMRKLSSVQRDTGLPSMADTSHRAADALEREAERLQAVEVRQGSTCEVCQAVGITPGIPSWNDCAACGGHGRVYKSKAQHKRAWPEGL